MVCLGLEPWTVGWYARTNAPQAFRLTVDLLKHTIRKFP